MLLLAPFWLEGLPRDLDGVRTALRGLQTELGGHQRELGGLPPELGGSQWELGGPQSELGGPSRKLRGSQGIKEGLGGEKEWRETKTNNYYLRQKKKRSTVFRIVKIVEVFKTIWTIAILMREDVQNPGKLVWRRYD